jgi:hypothetical protein
MSRSKHGRRRGLWKQSNPCDCWFCMPVIEKRIKLTRRTMALDHRQQVTEYYTAEAKAMASLAKHEGECLASGINPSAGESRPMFEWLKLEGVA